MRQAKNLEGYVSEEISKSAAKYDKKKESLSKSMVKNKSRGKTEL